MTDRTTTSYVLVEVATEVPEDAGPDFDVAIAEKLRRALGHHYHNSPRRFRTADVSDLLAYNRSTPGDPWDKPYPAMYADMVERLT